MVSSFPFRFSVSLNDQNGPFIQLPFTKINDSRPHLYPGPHFYFSSVLTSMYIAHSHIFVFTHSYIWFESLPINIFTVFNQLLSLVAFSSYIQSMYNICQYYTHHRIVFVSDKTSSAQSWLHKLLFASSVLFAQIKFHAKFTAICTD